MEALGRADMVFRTAWWSCLLTKPWLHLVKNLKRCFSDLSSLGHAAAQLENMTEQPDESLPLHMHNYSKMDYAATNKTAQENTDPPGFLDSWQVLTTMPYLIKFEDLSISLGIFKRALKGIWH